MGFVGLVYLEEKDLIDKSILVNVLSDMQIT